MKKILFILLFAFLLTGCSVEYKLEITDSIKETLELEIKDSDIDDDESEYFEYITGDNIYVYDDIDEKILYDKTIEEKKDITYITMSTTHSFDNYEKSKLLARCFSNPIVVNTDDYYYLNIDSPILCDNESVIKIVLKTDKKVIQENADSKRNGTYTWKLDKEDTNANILFQVSKTMNQSSNNGWLVIAIILVILIITFIIFRKIWKKNNE